MYWVFHTNFKFMPMKKYLFLILPLLFSVSMHAQIEKVLVETYYIADSADAADTTNGKLEAGAVTYRVYIDLKPGSRLKKIYGDANHALKISSTSSFYNHTGGKSFGMEFNNLNSLRRKTTGLDTWLTIGQLTKALPLPNSVPRKDYAFYGILKPQDRNGNAIAGSANLPSGSNLLSNDDPASGIPLTVADGLDTMVISPSSFWADNGIKDSTGEDSTIFGSLKPGSEFISNDMYLVNTAGIKGVIPDSNQVLVAQLTTKGQLSFELNVEVEWIIPGTKDKKEVVKYVANADTLLDGEEFFRMLKYPYVEKCGCPDPNYVEYNTERDCDKTDSCKTLIVFGCMDAMACNYDPNATYNVQTLCCYPGRCNDRDLELLCPDLVPVRNKGDVIIFPNPVQDNINIQFSDSDNKKCKYIIYDSFGRVIIEKNIGVVAGTTSDQVNVSHLSSGMYILRSFIGDVSENKMFMKH